ncbi:MAG: hypothetical protein ACI8TQ_001589 [Planctomycetota bacterium]|jgi:hypothetical protein
MSGMPLAKLDLSDLIAYAFYFFIFVAPILKALFKKMKKDSDSDTDTNKYPLDEEFEFEDSDVDPWEELMRGTSSKPAPDPPVIRAKAEIKQIQRATPVEDHSELLGDSIFKALDSSTSPMATPHAEHHELVTHFDTPKFVSATGASLAGEAFQSLQNRSAVAESASKQRRRARKSAAHGWRKAVLHREILSAPVALRSGAPDLLGLR